MMRWPGCALLAGLLLSLGPARAAAQSGKGPAVDFSRDVLPILSGKCYACHGPDKTANKGGVRLHARELALKPGRSGAVPVKPGKAAESEAVRRVFADDEEERMPPAKGGKALTAAEKETLRRWVEQGAEYRLHWAFVRPARPPLPAVKDRAWVRNEVDAFVLARLEKEGIRPSPEADRPTLIRRLSLDLRGLPPTLKEVDDFLADTSPDAYDKLVGRMLDSPHYGEKLALIWLDLARYGDTSGFHRDSFRQVWLWREWVIDAFNKNMPFDRFTVEQLAGDLLPNATVAQKIATGFNRNTRFNEEGGVDPEEYVIRYNVDRAGTLGQVWLGLTLGCAECHTHKYDPVTQKEFYQLYAYFNGIREPMVSMNHDVPLPPILKVPSPEQEKELAKLQKEADELDEGIVRELKRVRYVDPLEGRFGPPDVGEFAFSLRAWEAKERDNPVLPPDLQAALKLDRGKRAGKQQKLVRDFYLRRVWAGSRELLGPLEQELDGLRTKIKKVEDAIPHTMVCEEMEKPPPAYVLLRGDFLSKGEKVGRAVPAAFPPLPEGAPNNRLGLARWLVRPDHPLTARVAVNRLWAQMLGAGIVRTLGDLGTQGDQPSHPELLDWLAVEFVERGWDVKAVLKQIALSSTYRQASTYRAERADPDNRLLYRAPRYRLGGEEVRDGALAVSGLLSRKVGGPSFMPYQPDEFYKGKFEGWQWSPSTGEEQYRRGLYTFWRRTSLHPMFAVFDAPTRAESCVARPRTNTPLQALVTLNAPTFVEAARVFAQRILTEGPADLDGRLTFAFRTALARRPEAAELRVLRARYGRQRARFAKDREAASKLVNVGMYARDANLDVAEHAAWTAVAQVLLNLDEAIMRE